MRDVVVALGRRVKASAACAIQSCGRSGLGYQIQAIRRSKKPNYGRKRKPK